LLVKENTEQLGGQWGLDGVACAGR
jgi:hypothetical protein